jgi:hypothetical protein
MRFVLLLQLIAFKFKKASSTNKNFKKFLLGHECRIVIKTNDGKKGKRFIFADGTFSTDTRLDEYDAAMVWSDAAAGFNAMRKGEEGINQALQSHLAGIEGSLHHFKWFGAALNFVME